MNSDDRIDDDKVLAVKDVKCGDYWHDQYMALRSKLKAYNQLLDAVNESKEVVDLKSELEQYRLLGSVSELRERLRTLTGLPPELKGTIYYITINHSACCYDCIAPKRGYACFDDQGYFMFPSAAEVVSGKLLDGRPLCPKIKLTVASSDFPFVEYRATLAQFDTVWFQTHEAAKSYLDQLLGGV